jgi:hypothetical protein
LHFFFFGFVIKCQKFTQKKTLLSLSLSFFSSKKSQQKQSPKAKAKSFDKLKLVVEPVVFFGAKFGCGSSKPSA